MPSPRARSTPPTRAAMGKKRQLGGGCYKHVVPQTARRRRVFRISPGLLDHRGSVAREPPRGSHLWPHSRPRPPELDDEDARVCAWRMAGGAVEQNTIAAALLDKSRLGHHRPGRRSRRRAASITSKCICYRYRNAPRVKAPGVTQGIPQPASRTAPTEITEFAASARVPRQHAPQLRKALIESSISAAGRVQSAGS